MEEAVSENTVPAFIWATASDEAVPVANSLCFARALSDKGVRFELHIYPNGQHGLSTCRAEINQPNPDLERMSKWIDDCVTFFQLQK